MSYSGQPLKRIEDPRLVRGEGLFVDDVKLPGMLYASFLRSPHAHARLRSIEVEAARHLPGVVAVLTGEDIAGVLGDIPPRVLEEWEMDELQALGLPVLAQGKVFFVGQTVAVVVARERCLARDAVDLIEVDYDPLPPIVDPLEAVREDATPLHEAMGTNIMMWKYHDRQGSGLDEAFAQADRVIRQQYIVPRLAPLPLETRGCVVHFEPQSDRLTVWASTQSPHRYRSLLAMHLNRSPDRVRVIAPDVGGGFGEKGGLFPEDIAVAYLSVALGQPINWVAERRENMLTFHGRGHTAEVEVAVKNDGTLLGLRMRNVVDGGAFCANSTTTPPYTSSHRIMGPYQTPAARVEVLGVTTNKGPTGAYRGAGGPESAFCMERTMDLIAQDLGLDPADVRRKNFIRPEAFPYQTATGLTYDSGDYEKVLDRALELSDYAGWREKARHRVTTDGPLIGVGLATVIKMGGAAGEARTEEARITIASSGQITARTGVSPHGQGSAICFAQIVADQLGVTPSDVEVLYGDTDVVPSGGGTGATRGMVVGGSAMYVVGQQARQKLSRIASHLFNCPAEDIVFEEGRVYPHGNPSQATAFSAVASAAYHADRLPPDVEIGLEFHDRVVFEIWTFL
jgi:carbon-monoxide dehydrogenase large subunit